MKENGFIQTIILVGFLTLALVIGGIYYINQQSGKNIAQNKPGSPSLSDTWQTPTPKPTNRPSPTSFLPMVTEDNETMTPELAKQILPLDETALRQYEVTVQVVDMFDKAPVPGVPVEIVKGSEPTGLILNLGETDKNGVVKFNIPPGTYNIGVPPKNKTKPAWIGRTVVVEIKNNLNLKLEVTQLLRG